LKQIIVLLERKPVSRSNALERVGSGSHKILSEL